MDSQQQTGDMWTHHEAIINGVRLHYVEAGAGPLVVLLHGFPEFWYSWRYKIPALAAAGFRTIAPDMRGYNTSEKPIGVQSYHLGRLVDDVLGLIQHAGVQRATVVGHDWGGAVAWSVAMHYPQAVDKLVVLNAPHPRAFIRELRTLEQLRNSAYILFFQLPWLPELMLQAGSFALIVRALCREPVRPGAFTESDIEQYRRALSQPGALTASINYYRALFRRNPFGMMGDLCPINKPTLLIWGEQDRYLGVRLTEGLERWVPSIRVECIADASHWVQVDAYERVNQLLIDFLRDE